MPRPVPWGSPRFAITGRIPRAQSRRRLLLYLHGLSYGDFVPALEQFLGGTGGLFPATVTRLTKQWSDDHAAFQNRDLSDRDYVYV